MKTGTLSYVKRATKAEQGTTGVVYHHNFLTGWQNLVFGSDEAAERFAKANGWEFHGPRKPRKRK